MIPYLLIVLMLLNAKLLWAQEVEPPADLTTMLTNLKQSADALGVSNAQLKSTNAQLREEIGRLRLKLGQLKAQEDQLTAQKIKLQDKNEQKAKQMASLQQSLFAINTELEQIATAQKQAVERVAKLKQEDSNINEQIDQISTSSIEFQEPIESDKDVAKRKEKINLLKMLDQSHLRQEQLSTQLLLLKPSGASEDVAQLTAEGEILLERIKGLKAELDASNADAIGDSLLASNDIAVLTKEMSVLEANYQQLKDLWVKMQDKAQVLMMTSGQKEEKDKLAANLSDLNRESSALKGQLHGLREQMVDLDKRKTYLQQVLSQQ